MPKSRGRSGRTYLLPSGAAKQLAASAIALAQASAGLAHGVPLAGAGQGQGSGSGSASHGVPLAGAGSAVRTATGSLSGGSGGSTGLNVAELQADWTARSTASGVETIKLFESSAAVTAVTHQDGTQANVVWNPTGGIMGKGCVRINMPASGGTNPGAVRWAKRPGNVGYGSGDEWGMCAIRLGPSMLTPSVNGGGFKLIYIRGGYNAASPNSSSSHSDDEIVLGGANWRDIPNLYRQHFVSGETSFNPVVGSDIFLQDTDRGASATIQAARYCMYQSGLASPGCFFFNEERWLWVKWHVKTPTEGVAGGSGNLIDLWVAHDGDTSWLKIYTPRNFEIGQDTSYASGGPGFWCSGYDSGRTSAPYDTFLEIDQVAHGTADMSPSVPVARKITPTWRAGLTALNWSQLPNTNIDAVTPGGQGGNGPIQKVRAWNGWMCDVRLAQVRNVAAGGHLDYSGNEVNLLDLLQNSPAWSQERAPTAFAQVPATSTDLAYYNDGRPSSRHTYTNQWFDPVKRRPMMGGGSMWGVGNIHTETDGFNIATGDYFAANTFPDWPTDANIGGPYSAPICVDPQNGYVYRISNFAICRFNRNKNTMTVIRTGDGAVPFGQKAMAAFDSKRRRILQVGGVNAEHHAYFPDSDTISSVTISGAAASTVMAMLEAAMVYDEDSDAFYCRDEQAGGAVYKIDAATLAATSLSTTGGSSIPAADSSGGLFSKWFHIPVLDCLVLPSHTYAGVSWVLPLKTR